MELIINEEFKNLIPRLQDEEKRLLERSILNEGCRDSLIIWNNTIIDGHNRYEICTRNDIDFEIEEMSFENKSQVKKWMIDNQLARRNLTDSQRRYFVGKRYEEEKRPIGFNQHSRSGQNVQPSKTAEEIAEENNTNERTVRRNADYSKAIDNIQKEAPEIAEKILSEEIKLNNKEVLELAKKEEEIIELNPEEILERKKVFKEIERGTPYKEVKKPHVSNNSGNNEWYTPIKFLDIARETMGSIDTDPATSEVANKNVKASTIYTEENNGLEKDWIGNVWMNPPYAQPLIQQFADKLIEEIEKGNTKQAMVLVNNATETKWFNTLSKKAKAIWFMRGRVKFIDRAGNSTGAPLQGQAILYFGNKVDDFIDNCEGLVCRCSYE